ncbi:neo-calmodulin-like [Tubulanus polymorphus]|uniref:neo-calmodulin-like n=1 Tax=Tubulanus polymorphus TaxID=672921 RepID=UPI003DA61E05
MGNFASANRKENHYDENNMKKLREAFNRFDKDGDGKISIEELKSLMKTLGHDPTDEELQKFMSAFDKDGNNSIEFKEFIDMMLRRERAQPEDIKEMQQAFNVFDKDGDGYITAEELKSVLGGLGEKLSDSDVQEMMKEADLDRDGKINYEEFSLMLCSSKIFK